MDGGGACRRLEGGGGEEGVGSSRSRVSITEVEARGLQIRSQDDRIGSRTPHLAPNSSRRNTSAHFLHSPRTFGYVVKRPLVESTQSSLPYWN